jgi:IS5 family transposase
MYRTDLQQTEFVDFYLPFGGKLSASNRWVKLAGLVPWEKIEACYRQSLEGTGMGAPAKSARIAFGALIIKERLGVTDEETVEQITENPYLQYFLGLHEYRKGPLFDPSMMVHFRSRFGEEEYQQINSEIIRRATGSAEAEKDDEQDREPPGNEGKLLVDATCTPADITYPTDLKLLNQAREKTEGAIDKLHAPFAGETKKPRTYRQKARRQYLAVAKQKKPGARKIRKAIGQQLRYLKRNLGNIDTLLKEDNALDRLTAYEQRCLETIGDLHVQQCTMYEERTHSIANRIVSISQPHVRPMVRGKAGKKVEFGAKVSISHLKEGYVSLDRLSWDAYNESADLPTQIENYRERLGHHPASVHADAIYRTRKNRDYCKERGIRLSGKPLGRPKKETEENKEALRAQRKQQREDEKARIPVEGKFGVAKRKGTLGRVMAKLAHTSESVIHIGFIMLNLDKWLRQVLFWLRPTGWKELLAILRVRQSHPITRKPS